MVAEEKPLMAAMALDSPVLAHLLKGTLVDQLAAAITIVRDGQAIGVFPSKVSLAQGRRGVDGLVRYPV